MSGYKPAAIQTYPILGEKITQDTLYWNNYKVSVYVNFSSMCYTLDTLVENESLNIIYQQLIVWTENLISDIFLEFYVKVHAA